MLTPAAGALPARGGRGDALAQPEHGGARVLPPGPARDARDATFAAPTTAEWDDEMMRAMFESTQYVFGYVASEEADEWWIDWGRYAGGAQDAEQAKHMSLSPQALSMFSQITREETYEEA